MHNLTTSDGVLAYLKGTPFAANKVQQLAGGHSSFTYRATLETPLPTGETSVILKHAEGYIAVYEVMKLDAKRAEHEYNALAAVWSSGLINPNSTVQIPRPLHFDPETNTTFMIDLGAVDTLTKVLTDSIQAIQDGERWYEAPRGFRSGIEYRLGTRRLCGSNNAARNQILSVHHDMALRSATMLGLKEPWLESMIEAERQRAHDAGCLAIGDLWLDNILVSLVPEHGGLRLYVIDWEMVRPAPPEFDVGEITGTALSFARRYEVHDSLPFIPSLHRAYSQHRCLDPLRIAGLAGMDAMGLGTVLTWARDENEEFLRQVTSEGRALMELAHNHDLNGIKTKSVVKDLFSSGGQHMV
ncbi:phosphotransferase enzyme family protein [Ceratobasidium sp. AG-Ba]|nr:phosphotransferase enzyme family protein [Ceratobasidium sp. AG-Ba]QRW10936.1 phosphotransferase enzyme family protein [Ceratobasidium sp. AG-Ba]